MCRCFGLYVLCRCVGLWVGVGLYVGVVGLCVGV